MLYPTCSTNLAKKAEGASPGDLDIIISQVLWEKAKAPGPARNRGGEAMESKEPMSRFIYVLDKQDRIINVSDNWLLFAQENKAGNSCHPDLVINKSIWEFIDGSET